MDEHFARKTNEYSKRIHDLTGKLLLMGKGGPTPMDTCAMWSALMCEASLLEALLDTSFGFGRMSQEELYECYTRMYNMNFRWVIEQEEEKS